MDFHRLSLEGHILGHVLACLRHKSRCMGSNQTRVQALKKCKNYNNLVCLSFRMPVYLGTSFHCTFLRLSLFQGKLKFLRLSHLAGNISWTSAFFRRHTWHCTHPKMTKLSMMGKHLCYKSERKVVTVFRGCPERSKLFHLANKNDVF